MKQIQPFQKHWLQLTSIVVCRLKTLRSRQNGCLFPDNIFKLIFLCEKLFVVFRFGFHRYLLPRGQFTITLGTLIRIMALCKNRQQIIIWTFNISHILIGNKIVDHSNVVAASPVGTARTTSLFSTKHLASIDCTKTTARGDEKHLSLGIWCDLY